MSVTTGPLHARTDLAAPDAGPAPTALVRRAGLAVGAGALVWAATLATVGSAPTTEVGITISDLGALPFQLGLFALVTAQLRTRATGTSRLAAGLLRVEYVLLTVATLWSVLHGAVPAFRDDLWLGMMDAFWPLSMLGMFVIGVKIAFTRRWHGAARVWPLVAESWAVVTVPMFGLFGTEIASWIGAGHLLIGYVTLGAILALRPELTVARD